MKFEGICLEDEGKLQYAQKHFHFYLMKNIYVFIILMQYEDAPLSKHPLPIEGSVNLCTKIPERRRLFSDLSGIKASAGDQRMA